MADPGQRVHAAADAGGPGRADLAGLGGPLADSPSATAAAGAADVLRAWGKLGYPRRAKRLHECATVIAAEHGDVVPDDVEILLTCPVSVRTRPGRWRVSPTRSGFRWWTPMCGGWWRGRSTAGPTPAAPSAVRDLADVDALLPDDETAPLFSAALMELGATVCTARVAEMRHLPAERVRVAGRRASARRVGPPEPAQSYAGTDRQVRGRLLDVLRAQFGAGAAGATGRRLADRHRAARPGAGLAAGRRVGGADEGRPLRAGRRRRRD